MGDIKEPFALLPTGLGPHHMQNGHGQSTGRRVSIRLVFNLGSSESIQGPLVFRLAINAGFD